MKYGSDKMAELIADLDVQFIACNPGASFRGLHDSLVNHPTKKMPEMITCTHEEISVSIAHGYAKAAGKPMAVVTHNLVGLQHASMAIFNAWCDRAPVLLFGGTGPVAADKRRPWIDWIHTALVQGNMIRDYVKFDDQPASIQSLTDSVLRAYKLAVTEPAGPTYVCFDAGLQEQVIEDGEDEDIFSNVPKDAFAPGIAPAASPKAVDQIAHALQQAQWPVIIADFTGRSDEAFYALTDLVSTYGIAVLDKGARLNVPTNLPMNLTGVNDQILQKADVVLLLDDRDAAGSLCRFDSEKHKAVSILQPNTRVFSIGVQDYGVRSLSADYQLMYPTEFSVLADTKLALPQIVEALKNLKHDEEKMNKRKKAISDWHYALRQEWRQKAEQPSDSSTVPLSMLASKLWNFLKDRDFVLANGDLRSWTHKIFDMDQPRQHLGRSGGGGLGYGIGAAIGAALAYRDTDKLIVNIQSDGDLLFTSSGLWTVANQKLPMLIIMDNNRTYYNSEEHQKNVAKQRGRNINNSAIGTVIGDPYIDYAAMAKSMGVWGIGPIEDPNDVDAAIAQALEIVEKEKRPVLVDIVTKKAGYDNSK